MTSADLDRIEAALGLELPAAYHNIVLNFPFTPGTTDASLWDDAEAIIDFTLQHREGFCGAPPWPHELVFVGDDGAGCPYTLDTRQSPPVLLHLDHGDPHNLLDEPDDINTFVSKCLAEIAANPPNPPLTTGKLIMLIITVALVAACVGAAISKWVLL